jgi:hypothetical protein
MLTIRVVDLSDSVVVLRVEGRITGCWVEEFRRTCTAYSFAANTFADEVQLSLELSKVSFAGVAGIAPLKEQRTAESRVQSYSRRRLQRNFLPQRVRILGAFPQHRAEHV